MRCRCAQFLFCTCRQEQKALVKLAGSSSSTDAAGYNSLNITAVDIWLFGLLLLNTFLGSYGLLDLLTKEQLSEVRIHLKCKINLYMKTFLQRFTELQQYYSDNRSLCDLVQKCLEVCI